MPVPRWELPGSATDWIKASAEEEEQQAQESDEEEEKAMPTAKEQKGRKAQKGNGKMTKEKPPRMETWLQEDTVRKAIMAVGNEIVQHIGSLGLDDAGEGEEKSMPAGKGKTGSRTTGKCKKQNASEDAQQGGSNKALPIGQKYKAIGVGCYFQLHCYMLAELTRMKVFDAKEAGGSEGPMVVVDGAKPPDIIFWMPPGSPKWCKTKINALITEAQSELKSRVEAQGRIGEGDVFVRPYIRAKVRNAAVGTLLHLIQHPSSRSDSKRSNWLPPWLLDGVVKLRQEAQRLIKEYKEKGVVPEESIADVADTSLPPVSMPTTSTTTPQTLLSPQQQPKPRQHKLWSALPTPKLSWRHMSIGSVELARALFEWAGCEDIPPEARRKIEDFKARVKRDYKVRTESQIAQANEHGSWDMVFHTENNAKLRFGTKDRAMPTRGFAHYLQTDGKNGSWSCSRLLPRRVAGATPSKKQTAGAQATRHPLMNNDGSFAISRASDVGMRNLVGVYTPTFKFERNADGRIRGSTLRESVLE
ncbi:hypothetical protein HK097_000187 [Rhizophlyctis rosea]|uniref:Uncharacterized protein n=1 Tax=Rhizophlyctis rosea TaxID=64517 RepID=A0AAD5X8E9_9FUNG|nr:hypothetical protein HK097_000187 [Rhizophlyctis rosea]